MDTIFETKQVVPVPLEEAFAFFSDPKNLERITPPFLHFRITDQTTPEIGEGTEFGYTLRIHGIPCRWRSKIVDWVPNERFSDIQLKGPYAKWHHTHTFAPHPEGTELGDRVAYRLPMGWLGLAVAGWKVDADVRKIFDYRQACIRERMG